MENLTQHYMHAKLIVLRTALAQESGIGLPTNLCSQCMHCCGSLEMVVALHPPYTHISDYLGRPKSEGTMNNP